ncbi:phage antirepressor N-terminal domain-containing protein [Salinarimonas sp. NSM]|uniref:phage antirepressor N-terminal domain-containing protein n=1 Tax=Salinarimonas sp. NSM TaxID=3458003 RepID=UPI004036725F
MRNALTTITFHGANLVAIPGESPETTMVAMKPVVEGMGLDWGGQHKKVLSHPVLSGCVSVTEIPSEGGMQRTVLLPLNRLHFWLATISPNRIADPVVRERVILFQTEAADVLFEHFFGKALAGGDELAERTNGISRMLAKKVTGIERAMGALAGQVQALVVAHDPRRAVLDYVSTRQLLDEAKAIQKGRNGVNRRIGFEMRERALQAVPPVPLRRCPHSGVWLYPRAFADAYMRERGNGLVREHNDRQKGQGVIPFPDRRNAPERETV